MNMDKISLAFLVVGCVLCFFAVIVLVVAAARAAAKRDNKEYQRGRKYFEEPNEVATPIYLVHDETGTRGMQTQPIEGYSDGGSTNVLILNCAQKKQQPKKKKPAEPVTYAIPMPYVKEEQPKAEVAKRNSGDEFLDSLTDQELSVFVDKFMKGSYANVPAYQVGGKNDEFFKRVFIHACGEREKLPQNLLNKMCAQTSKYV